MALTKDERETLNQVHQAVLGIPGTDEKGLVGDLRDIKKDIQHQNSRLGKTETKVNRIIGGLIVLGCLCGAGFGIAQLLT